MIEIIFWTMFAIVFYTYLGYGILVYFLTKGKRKPDFKLNHPENTSLTVVHLIAAYNEQDYIEEKITNSLNLDYPTDQYQVWVVTDGSTDKTPDIVRDYPNVTHFHEDARKGKIHAVNRVMPHINADIVVFSDANTHINKVAIKNMIQHFHNEKVGVVAGEKRIHIDEKDEASSAGEGLYWKYESFLKQKDYALYSTVGAAGELFAIRTSLFEEVSEDMLIEDFYLSMSIAAKGFVIAYEPDAYAVEHSSASVKEESKRKIRIAAGGLQATWRLKHLFNVFRYKWLSFQFVSHRVLRWTLAPLFLPFILILNGILASTSSGLYVGLFGLQLLFYLLALIGWVLQFIKTKIKVFFIPFYFVFMNIAVYLGFVRLMRGKQSVLWARAERKTT